MTGRARGAMIRWASLSAAFLAPPLIIAVVGMRQLQTRQHPALLPPLPAGTALPAPPPHDPGKRTVVVLLGADLTEITDAIGPYEMFSRAGVFNVYAAASERRPTLLSGGLRILPHLALPELDARVAGQPPPIVVVPQIPNIASTENRPLILWMQRQAAAGALMHSWCTGAMALAEAGLLDGLTATAHWGDLDRLAERYPRVKWVRGVRWVDHGKIITSAGLTSGVDASLRVLSSTAGLEVAERVARELKYPNLAFATDPSAPQYTVRPADAVLLANAAFRLRREQIGIALYDGVGELDLSNLYDTHAYSAVADVHAVSDQPGFVRTQHGLSVLPSVVAIASDAPSRRALRRLDRFVIAGDDGDGRGSQVLASVQRQVPGLAGTALHRSDRERFALEPVIEDLARSADRLTARFALRRLEYRSSTVSLEGTALPWQAIGVAVASGLLGLAGLLAGQRLWRRRRQSAQRTTRWIVRTASGLQQAR